MTRSSYLAGHLHLSRPSRRSGTSRVVFASPGAFFICGCPACIPPSTNNRATFVQALSERSWLHSAPREETWVALRGKGAPLTRALADFTRTGELTLAGAVASTACAIGGGFAMTRYRADAVLLNDIAGELDRLRGHVRGVDLM